MGTNIYFSPNDPGGSAWVITFDGVPCSPHGRGSPYQALLGYYIPGLIITNGGGAGTFTGTATGGRREYVFALDPAMALWNSGKTYNYHNAVKTSNGKYWSCILANTGLDPNNDNGTYWQEITTGFSFLVIVDSAKYRHASC